VFRAGHVVHHDDVFQLRLALDGGDLLILSLGGDDGDPCSGIDQEDCDLVRGQGGVDGYIDSPQDEGGKVDDRPLPTVFCEQGYAIAFDDAPGSKGIGYGVDASHDLVARPGVPVTRGALPEDRALALAGREQSDYVYQGFKFEHEWGLQT
jgi:hypothetical protein